VIVETQATIRFTAPPTFGERMALRVIGVGVVLLTDRPIRNLFRYFGTFWNMGCWTISEYPITTPVEPTP
jgi:hypothetical protein